MENTDSVARLNVRNVDPALWRRLRIAAVTRGVPSGDLLNEAIARWLETEHEEVSINKAERR